MCAKFEVNYCKIILVLVWLGTIKAAAQYLPAGVPLPNSFFPFDRYYYEGRIDRSSGVARPVQLLCCADLYNSINLIIIQRSKLSIY